MADMPKNMVQVLRELAAFNHCPLRDFPDWFQERYLADPKFMNKLYTQAADDLEGMQKLNGKLYKTLYPD